QLLAKADAIEEQPVARPGIDHVVSGLRRRGHVMAVDSAPKGDLRVIGPTGSKLRIDTLGECQGAVLTPRSRVRAPGNEYVVACVIVHSQRRNAECVSVADRLLREGPLVVDRPQFLPGVIGDELAVTRTDGNGRERTDDGAGDGCAELAPTRLAREE